ncbi:hypothetical protein JDV02_003419 [Purpureocillium takamizusanense]|uniref:Peptidase A1 domain-containing protein n=1 Tax=Purpureocillium takamizusanense TaxID=2060973 RepID=A0A9Q8QCD3_9HYPO|nr:uncharacterized protein JDV02_003419 [Purpureocillium takamizusanense]UNI17040.1 hypothetical protein JDV02_003419 [Purpureocillium takamizusanense]
MQTFGAFLVSLVALSGLVAARPTNPTGIFSITTTHNRHFKPSGPLALAKAYRKFNKPLPKTLANAIGRLSRRQDTGSVVTKPQESDVEYLSAVQIGTPAQTVYLDFDTGSSDLWVFSSETQANQVKGQAVYKPHKSSSAKKLTGASWSIEYGDHSSSNGDVWTDIVSIGGLSVKNMAVENAKKVSQQFSDNAACSGLLGLGFSNLNTVRPTQQKTFFDMAMPNLKEPLFTANLKHKADGTYNFGYIDGSEHSGPIVYTNVDSSQGGWTFTSPGYAVGDDELNSESMTGIADTGTTLLLLPDDVVTAYYNKIQGSSFDNNNGGYVFPCKATPPDFKFGVEDSSIKIPGSYLSFAPVDESGESCFGGLQSSSGIGVNIFGDVALKAALVVFDGGNNQLGWAQK